MGANYEKSESAGPSSLGTDGAIFFSNDRSGTYTVGDYWADFVEDSVLEFANLSQCGGSYSNAATLHPSDLLFQDMVYVKDKPAEKQKIDPYYTSCYLSGEDISYTFLADGSPITDPPFSNKEVELSIYTTNPAHLGDHNMVLEVSVGTVGVDELTDSSQTFVATINDCCLEEPASGNLIADVTYNI